MADRIPTTTLNDGQTMPRLGLGVYKIPNAELPALVTEAVTQGYRGLDTAHIYGNEQGVGAAIAQAELPREELHITSKLWHTDHGYESPLRACQRSLATLKLAYLDLYLIHWPAPAVGLYRESWRALRQLQADGLVRSIGVSNFTTEHLDQIIQDGDIPAVNQIELHPGFPQKQLREWHQGKGIATQAWSPLGQGKLLTDPAVRKVAQRHEVTPAQVLLRWNLDLGNLVLAKTATAARLRENLGALTLDLTDHDREALAAMDVGHRTGPDPLTFGAQ